MLHLHHPLKPHRLRGWDLPDRGSDPDVLTRDYTSEGIAWGVLLGVLAWTLIALAIVTLR